MASVFKSLFGEHVQTSTKDGVITINLNLTLTLKIEQDGQVSVTPQVPTPLNEIKSLPVLPDLEAGEIINFGKNV